MRREDVKQLLGLAKRSGSSSFYDDYLEQALSAQADPLNWIKQIQRDLDGAVNVLEANASIVGKTTDELFSMLRNIPVARAIGDELKNRIG